MRLNTTPHVPWDILSGANMEVKGEILMWFIIFNATDISLNSEFIDLVSLKTKSRRNLPGSVKL